MGKPAVNFKSSANYGKWLAYGHMNGVFAKSPGNTPVQIKGKPKKVNHSESKAEDKKDTAKESKAEDKNE